MKVKANFFDKCLVGEITTFKFITTIVVVVLFSVTIPMSIISAANKLWFLNYEEELFVQETGFAETVSIVGEDVSQRGYNEKNFILENGNYLKQVYSEDVHYFDTKSRSFKEIDNTLQENGTEYVNSNNSFKVSFSKSTNEDEIVKIEEGNISLLMSPLMEEDGKNSTPAATANVLKENSNIKNTVIEKYQTVATLQNENHVSFRSNLDILSYFNSIEKTLSKVNYKEIYSGIDFEYALNGRSLKENIVVKKKQDNYCFKFKINVKNASLELDNGSIGVYDVDENLIFVIPKGFMYDSGGEYSDAVDYSLENKGGDYILSVKADATWINSSDRVLPVTIDPTIQGIYDYAFKTYWKQTLSNSKYVYNNTLLVQWDTTGFNCGEYAMLRFSDNIFANLSAAQISSAKLTLTRKSFEHRKWGLFSGWQTNTGSFNVYNNYYTTNDWDTVENFDNYTTATTLAVSAASANENIFTVTEYAKLAAQGKNYGIVLTVAETSSTHRKIEYYAVSDGNVPVTALPTLSIVYAPYQTPSVSGGAASAGKGEFDLKTGDLIFTADDIIFTGGAMPLSVSRIFGRGTASGVGAGFRLNLSQTLEGSGDVRIYTDASGIQYTFTNDVNEEINATLESMFGISVITMYNQSKVVFNADGKLIELIDGYGHSIKLIYDSSSRLSTAIDSAQREIYFNYEGDRLEGIYKDASFNVALVQYGNVSANGVLEQLATVTYNSNTELSCSYEYDSSGRLIKAIDNDGAYAQYSYLSGASTIGYFVRNVKEVLDYVVFSDTSVTITRYNQTVDTVTASRRTITVTDNLKGISSFYEYLGDTLYSSATFNSTGENIKDVTSSMVLAETNGDDAEYVRIENTYNRGIMSDKLVFAEYFSGEETPIDTEASFVAVHRQNAYVKDDGDVQSSLWVAGSGPKTYIYNKTVALNSSGSTFEYYLTFWANRVMGDFVIVIATKYGFFNDYNYVYLNEYTATPAATSGFRQYGIKITKNSQGDYPSQVEITLNLLSSSCLLYIDDLEIRKVSLEDRINDLNFIELQKTVGANSYKRYYADGLGNIVYDIYTYADASRKILLNVKYQNGNLKQEYEYDSYDHKITRIKEYDRNGNFKITAFVYNDGFLVEERYYERNSEINYGSVIYAYAEDTGFLIGITDRDGTVTEYDNTTGSTKVTSPDGVVTNIIYEENTFNVARVITAGVTVDYGYNIYGNLNSIAQNGYVTQLEYDVRGNISGVIVGGQRLVDFAYAANGTPLLAEYANNQTISYSYDAKGNLEAIFFNGELFYEYEYDAHGNIQKEIDYVNGTTTLYSIELKTNIMDVRAQTSDGMSVAKSVNSSGRLETELKVIENAEIVAGTYNMYAYNADGDISQIWNMLGSYSYSYEYNSYGFLSAAAIGNFKNTITYTSDDMIDEYAVKYGETVKAAYKYVYDYAGRILEVKENNIVKIKYTYDALGRLSREDNAYLDKTAVYAYDNGGNILNADVYAYTAGNISSALKTREIIYGYAGGMWRDQLTSYTVKDVAGGNLFVNAAESYTVAYDEIGNPTQYKGETLTWIMGRRLDSFGAVGYKYNANGYRTEKSFNGTVTKYYLDAEQIFAESAGGAYTWYYYGALGIQSFKRDGTQYYYMLDAQGNITGIVNTSGAVLARYAYDAWGKATVYDANWNADTNANSIGNLNPFRYRGYYYDRETGLYYLNSRYYDPETGRFISVDNPLMALEGVHNLYAYCHNDPVNYIDPNGYDAVSSFLTAWFILGEITGIVTEIYDNYGHYITAFGLTSTGIAAIGTALAIINSCNPGWWIALAATLCAGTGVLFTFAAAEVREGITGENFLRDSFIFQGNRQTYDITMLVTEIVVAAGTIVGQFGLAHGLIGQCFAEGTAVLAVAGAVAIENIEIGDLVWAYDETTGDAALKEVVQTFENETYELTTVRTNDGQEIVSTPEHPYFVKNRGWILAKDLRAGDILLNVNGQEVVVEQVQHEILENPITVYNFEVKDYHTYFVAQNINAPIQEFVLVHNKCDIRTGTTKDYSVHDSRRAAYRAAKRDAGVLGKQPITSNGRAVEPAIDHYGHMMRQGATYNFAGGKQILLHSGGHPEFGITRHFNYNGWHYFY